MNPPFAGSNDRQADFAAKRRMMVNAQLRNRGINDARVIQAMLQVPREEFVPEPLRAAAYEDCALPIELRQTISQPFTVAFMCQALALAGGETVLEIGTGSGYAAAVLAHLAARVYTVERLADLAQSAAARLSQLGYSNVHVKLDDGTLGWPEHAPYDAIVVTAGGQQLPTPYLEQLKQGGRVVIPLGRAQASQTMFRYTRTGDDYAQENLGQFTFVPLIGRHGWHPA